MTWSESSFVTKPGLELRSADSQPSGLSTTVLPMIVAVSETSACLSRVQGCQRNWNNMLVGQEYWLLLLGVACGAARGWAWLLIDVTPPPRSQFCWWDLGASFNSWVCSCARLHIVLLFLCSSVLQGWRVLFKCPSLEVCLGLLQLAHNWTLRIYFATWYRFKLVSFRETIL